MRRSQILASVLAVAAWSAAAIPARTQSLDTSKPIQVKAVKPKVVKFQGEVMHANSAAITVRSSENERIIRTFSYSPKIREQMQHIIDAGGYRYGDKVQIRYEAGSDVALQIKGKPSKPI